MIPFNNAQTAALIVCMAWYLRRAALEGTNQNNNMNTAVILFLSGAATAIAALLILIPIRGITLREGALPRLAAGLAVLVPLLIVVLLNAGQGRTPTPDASAIPVALTLPPSSQESDWSGIAHAFASPTTTAGGAATAPVEQRAEMSVAQMEAATRAAPENPAHWLALAQTQRLARDYPAAVKAYAEALKLDDRNADAWADYADALASASNRKLAGEPAKAIARALALDPRHLKGLWLAASLDMEQRRYADALNRWQQLRAALPNGSPDVKIIDANIAEARGLASGSAGG